MPGQDPKISVITANILEFPCDALILKYAQAWHGADLAVAHELGLGRGWDLGGGFCDPGDFRLVDSQGKIEATHVLFEGVPTLRRLNYAFIREFSQSAIAHLNKALPDVRHIALTIHGVNVGMDERESFLSQLAGILDALSDSKVLSKLEEISFVEKNTARALRLSKLLKDNYSQIRKTSSQTQPAAPMTKEVANAGLSKTEKPHIFVAMPFSPEMEDVYIFGIQGPVQEAGFLCERVDQAVFTGDIVDRIKQRIETAKLVIADLSGANANVYLEVGYAWGRNVNALLICKNIDELKFDVKGQRCVVYSSINDLKKKLSEELKVHAK